MLKTPSEAKAVFVFMALIAVAIIAYGAICYVTSREIESAKEVCLASYRVCRYVKGNADSFTFYAVQKDTGADFLIEVPR